MDTGWRMKKNGMTLIEVLMALVILGVAMLGLGTFVGKFVRGTRENAVLSTASDLVVDRLEIVKGAASYAAVDAFAGSETLAAPYAGFLRTTQVQRVGGDDDDDSEVLEDYKAVTVSVTGPGLTVPVKKTTFIAQF